MESSYFAIQGKKPLSGDIEINGCKNAATPIIAATLLTSDPCYIKNLPKVEDIFRMLEIVKKLGAEVEWIGEREVKIQAKNIDSSKIDSKLVMALRSSVFLMGPLLARFGNIIMPKPGGCLIGVRPIDAHLQAFLQFGAGIETEGRRYSIFAEKLTPGKIVLSEFSVTATENALMTASLLPGKSVIKIAAIEPHVMDLAVVLSKMGARINWLQDHTVEVIGQKKLKGFSHSIIHDSVEAGSFMIMAALVNNHRVLRGKDFAGKLILKNVLLNTMELVVQKLKEFGIRVNETKNVKGISDVEVIPPKDFLSVPKVQALPYPGIPTDLQCIFGVLATQSPGDTLIHDPMYEGRLRYLNELNRMGAEIAVLDSHRAIVKGPVELQGVNIKNYDLRSGSALINAALIAEGESTIDNIYQIDRGYENIEERLQKIGADIKRIDVERTVNTKETKYSQLK
jgi:UDP-N-acetylglucosamine 1-carboxyvinyltransferase